MSNYHSWILKKPRLMREGYTFTNKQAGRNANIRNNNDLNKNYMYYIKYQFKRSYYYKLTYKEIA